MLCIVVGYFEQTELGFGYLVKIVDECYVLLWTIYWANWTGFWLFSENCWWLCFAHVKFGWNFLGSREKKINSWIVFTFLSGNFLKCVWSLWNLIAGGLISCTIDASGLWTKWNLHLSKTKGGYEVMVPILY